MCDPLSRPLPHKCACVIWLYAYIHCVAVCCSVLRRADVDIGQYDNVIVCILYMICTKTMCHYVFIHVCLCLYVRTGLYNVSVRIHTRVHIFTCAYWALQCVFTYVCLCACVAYVYTCVLGCTISHTCHPHNVAHTQSTLYTHAGTHIGHKMCGLNTQMGVMCVIVYTMCVYVPI